MKKIYSIFLLVLGGNVLLAQWSQTSGPLGGRTYDIEVIDGVTWAGTYTGVYFSYDEGHSWIPSDIATEDAVIKITHYEDEILLMVVERNAEYDVWDYQLYRSIDNGQSWVISDVPIYDTLVETFELFRMGGRIFYRMDGRMVFSMDNGTTWTPMEFPEYAREFAAHNDTMYYATSRAIFTSTDFGENWMFLDSIRVETDIYIDDRLLIFPARDSLYISYDRGQSYETATPPEDFFFGAIKKGFSEKLYALDGRVYVSEDEGFTWDTLNSEYIAGPHDLLETGDEFLFTTSQGFYKTQNNGASWYPSNKGYIGSDVYTIHSSPSGELFIYSNEGFYRSPNSGLSWFKMDLPFTFFPQDMAFKEDTVFISDRWKLIMIAGNEVTDLTENLPYSQGYRLTFHQDRLFLIIDDMVVFTDDLGTNWDTLNMPPIDYLVDDFKVIGGNYLIISNSGEAYRSTDIGNSWTQILDFWSPGAGHKHTFVKIEGGIIVPDNDSWWISYNNGFTWTEFFPEGDLPFEDSWHEPKYPTRLRQVGNLLFGLIENYGVFLSSNNGYDWQPLNDGFSNFRISNLALADDILFAATKNGGVWRRSMELQSISGITYRDNNNNGIRDETEPSFPNVQINTTPFPSFTNSNTQGHFNLYTETTNNLLVPSFASPYVSFNPEQYALNQVVESYDFGVYLEPNKNDLCIDLTNITVFRPGFDNTLLLTVKNIGTTQQAPEISLVLDEDITFLDATPSPNWQIGDSLFWQLDTLDAFECQAITLIIEVDFLASLEDTTLVSATVFPIENDENADNNVAALQEPFLGSYDPNDKQVKPSEFLTPEQFEQGIPLTYTIRFQNTGTYYAENVRITDTLDRKLDIHSLEIVAASHEMQWFIKDENALEFVFENIFLPDSTTNELESHGFVKFNIRPQENINLGATISNTAHIYFDFNAPIVTNTTKTIYDVISTTFRPRQVVHPLLIYPNPTDGIFTIQVEDMSKQIGQLRLVNSVGQTVYQSKVQFGEQQLSLDMRHLTTGNYLIYLDVNNKKWNGQLVLAK